MAADLLIYALVAAGLVFWLRSVLGTRHGDERERPNPFASGADSPLKPRIADAGPKTQGLPILPGADNVDLKAGLERHMAIASGAPEQGLMEIVAADRTFEPAAFLRGAQDAFVMIVEAFAAGDRDTLRDLLDDSVYQAFDGALDQRAREGQKASVEIYAVRRAEITAARLERKTAFITVRFVADETNVLRDRDDQVISGNPDRVRETIDIWTFRRDTRSRTPAWQVCETRDEDAAARDDKTVPDSR